MTNTVLARNHVHHNNMALAYDWGVEAGGGKTMDSDGVTFDSNVVDSNRGPGIWFDTRSTNATIINNKVHHNDREGIFFEIGNGARIAGNAVWNNGFGFAEWGYGAGILVSSSDHVTVTGNTVAWNARGISVISQAREFSPHDHDTVTNNVVVSAGGAPLAGFYDDHGGTLWAAANANSGSGNRYWAGVSEPSSERFMWSNWRSTLGAYNATRGDEGGTYLSAREPRQPPRRRRHPDREGRSPPGAVAGGRRPPGADRRHDPPHDRAGGVPRVVEDRHRQRLPGPGPARRRRVEHGEAAAPR